MVTRLGPPLRRGLFFRNPQTRTSAARFTLARMAVMERDQVVPVRLGELPLALRLHAAVMACREETDAEERLRILAAAIAPSERVYWVSEDER